MGWFSKKLPVYSDVGNELYRLLIQDEDKWENGDLLKVYYPPLDITLTGYMGFNHCFYGMWFSNGVDVSIPVQGNVTLLTKDDHQRLYDTIAALVDKRTRKAWAEAKDKGNRWIKDALGLKGN